MGGSRVGRYLCDQNMERNSVLAAPKTVASAEEKSQSQALPPESPLGKLHSYASSTYEKQILGKRQ